MSCEEEGKIEIKLCKSERDAKRIVFLLIHSSLRHCQILCILLPCKILLSRLMMKSIDANQNYDKESVIITSRGEVILH
jgi:hypothetical protein